MKVKNCSYNNNCLNVEVRWGESDAAGIVYYVRYFDWFTEGRMFFLKNNGLDYMENFHDKGIVAVSVSANCEYKRALRPGDMINVKTELTEATPARMTFTYRVFKSPEGELAAKGKTVHAYVDDSGKPFNLQKRFPELWNKLNGLVSKY